MFSFSGPSLCVIRFPNICKFVFLSWKSTADSLGTRSELDDMQIQQLFQQLIQRLIFYMSINSKQITTKLVVAVRSQMTTTRIRFLCGFSVRSFDPQYDARQVEERHQCHHFSIYPIRKWISIEKRTFVEKRRSINSLLSSSLRKARWSCSTSWLFCLKK